MNKNNHNHYDEHDSIDLIELFLIYGKEEINSKTILFFSLIGIIYSLSIKDTLYSLIYFLSSL